MHLHSRSRCSEKHSHLDSTVRDGLKFLACCMDTGRSVPIPVVPADLQTHPMLEEQSQHREGYCRWSPEQAHACHRFLSHLGFFLLFFGAVCHRPGLQTGGTSNGYRNAAQRSTKSNLLQNSAERGVHLGRHRGTAAAQQHGAGRCPSGGCS